MLPEELGVYPNLRKKIDDGGGGAVLSGGAMEKDVVAGGRPSWVGVGAGFRQ